MPALIINRLATGFCLRLVSKRHLTLAADQERLHLARETLKCHQATFDLTRRRFDVGVASALDVRQAQTSVEATRVDIARYTSLVAEGESLAAAGWHRFAG